MLFIFYVVNVLYVLLIVGKSVFYFLYVVSIHIGWLTSHRKPLVDHCSKGAALAGETTALRDSRVAVGASI